MPSLARFLLPLSLLLAPALGGCGVAVHQPSRSATFDLDGAREINDEDVRKAFEAKPQLSRPMSVAFYTFDASKADSIEAMLRQVPGVSDVYRLPTLLVTGQRRYDEQRSWDKPAELSIKKLRMLAARSHADVVLVFDYGHKIESSPNGWVALTPLVLPIFFAPFIDKKLESYLETHVIDTRNGYLYAHITADEQGEQNRVSIYHDADRGIGDQWTKILGATRDKLTALTASATPRSAAPATLVAPAKPAGP